MKIEKISLDYFRGIEHLEVVMNGYDTDVYGPNGAGKTTLANAICWVLCNCPITGEKEFDPQTAGVHQQRHGAQIDFTMDDGTPISFGKYYYEVWKKKRGVEYVLDGHKTEYFINNTSCSKKAYEATVESATKCDSKNLRLLIVLGFFMTMSQDARRNVLFELIPDITDEEVILGVEELEGFKDVLKVPSSKIDGHNDDLFYKPNEYKEAVTVRKRNLQKELEYMPVRISELEGSLPNMTIESADDIKEEINSYKSHVKDCQRLIDEMNNPKEIIELKQKIENIKKERLKNIEKMSKDVIEMNKKKQELIDQKMEEGVKTNNKMSELNCEIIKLEVEVKELEEQRNRLLEEYGKESSKKWTEQDEICPTCGQKIPAEKINELKDQFSKEKNLKLARINEEGQVCSKSIIASLKKDIDEKKKQVADMATKCKELHDDILSLKHTMGELADFDSTEDGVKLGRNMRWCNEQINKFSSDAEKVKITLEEQIKEWNDKIQEAYKRLGVVSNGEDSLKRIDELKKKRKEYGAQLEQIEYGLEMCKIFTLRKADMITEKINHIFNHIQFKLFRERLNGNLQEVCEPMIRNSQGQLIEYKSANTAAQINANMEIMDKLNEHYGTRLPILMDRAESVTEPIVVKEQLIRFIVSSTYDELTTMIKAKKKI